MKRLNKEYLNITEEEWTLIEQYLMATVQNEELLLFRKKLNNDVELQKKVNDVRELQLGIKEAVLQNEMNYFHNNLTGATKRNENRPWSVFLKKYTLVAASIGLLFLMGWLIFFRSSKEDKIFSSFYIPDPGLITAMSTQQDYIFDKGMVEYKIGNYKQALQLWSSLEPERKNSDTLQYFLGNAFLADNENSQALKYFTKVSENKQSAFNEDANWYLGLVYIKRNDFATAYKYISLSSREEKQQLLKLISTMQPKAE